MKGFREIVSILNSHGIDIGHLKERELFIDVYRFMATRHVLNTINWSRFAKDSVFQLVFPQPGMINEATVKQYCEASSDEERQKKMEMLYNLIKNTNAKRVFTYTETH